MLTAHVSVYIEAQSRWPFEDTYGQGLWGEKRKSEPNGSVEEEWCGECKYGAGEIDPSSMRPDVRPSLDTYKKRPLRYGV